MFFLIFNYQLPNYPFTKFLNEVYSRNANPWVNSQQTICKVFVKFFE